MTGPANGTTPHRVSYYLPLKRPVVTWILLGIIIAVFLAETLAGGSEETEVLIRFGAKVTPLIAAGEYWRLFTSLFIHIGWLHLAFNGYALAAIGSELERLLGSGRYLAVYLLSGLVGSLASYAFSPNLSAGASGSIFGLIGALAAFFLLHRRVLGTWGNRRLANIVFLIGINLFLGFTRPGIDNLSHLGGLIGGLGLGWALAPRYQVVPTSLLLVDRNRLGRYWPALVLAVLLLVAGITLVTELQHESSSGHLVRAQMAMEREEWAKAVTELELALTQDPDQPEAHFYLGLAHNYLEQPQSAVDAYQSALALDPDLSEAHWNLALTYLDLRRYAEAKAHFEDYLRLEPDEAEEVQPYLEDLRLIAP